MRPRLPSYDHFSVAVGVFVGGCLLALASLVGLPLEEPLGGVALVVALAVWTLLARVPERVNAMLARRLHVVVGVLSCAPIVVLAANRLVGRLDSSPPLADPSPWVPLGIGVGGVVVAAVGEHRYATHCYETEGIHAIVTTTPRARWRQFLSSLVWGTLGYALVTFALDTASLFGLAAFGVLHAVLNPPSAKDLVVLDSGLLIRDDEDSGGSLTPWRRIRGVDVVDGTLRVRRGLPFPRTYRCDFSERAEAKRVADAIRRCRRRT